jgi:hypothetical protein
MDTVVILDSGSSSRKGVEVQVLSSAPIKSISCNDQKLFVSGLLSFCGTQYGAVLSFITSQPLDQNQAGRLARV